jgi:hypothetical protein
LGQISKFERKNAKKLSSTFFGAEEIISSIIAGCTVGVLNIEVKEKEGEIEGKWVVNLHPA